MQNVFKSYIINAKTFFGNIKFKNDLKCQINFLATYSDLHNSKEVNALIKLILNVSNIVLMYKCKISLAKMDLCNLINRKSNTLWFNIKSILIIEVANKMNKLINNPLISISYIDVELFYLVVVYWNIIIKTEMINFENEFMEI